MKVFWLDSEELTPVPSRHLDRLGKTDSERKAYSQTPNAIRMRKVRARVAASGGDLSSVADTEA